MTNVVSFPAPAPEKATPLERLPPPFAELGVTTNYSFLRGASHPEEIAVWAASYDLAAVAVTDRNTVAGVVRGWTQLRDLKEKMKDRQEGRLKQELTQEEKENPEEKKDEERRVLKLKYIAGCRLAFRDGTPDVFAWPTDRAAWGRLCRLLTGGNRRAPKGECHLDLTDLLEWGKGIILGVMAPPIFDDQKIADLLAALFDAFPGDVRLMANHLYDGSDRRRLIRLSDIASAAGVPLMATNDVHYHHPDRRQLQDVVTCVREKTTLREAGFRLAANAERHLKPPQEMARLFADYPDAIAETLRVAGRITFDLGQLKYYYPEESTGGFGTPDQALAHFAFAGAKSRYPDGIKENVRKKLTEELAIIAGREYAPYFLTVFDIVRYARSKGILCQGRGSAANSVVCYCLGITEVDPAHAKLLFERFISPNRNEPPDIDVDFEHERRETVMQYIYEKYSRERAGIAATVITYRTRSAIRDVGKVFDLSEDTVGALASTTWGWSSDGVRDEDVTRAGLDPAERSLKMVLELCRDLIGFPRHLSQHVGGFVMTNDRLDESVPVMNAAMEDRTHIEWDKDDLDAVGMMKVDVLALGMLSCIRRALDFIAEKYGEHLTLDTIRKAEPKEDPAVYRMLGRADTVGVFQVESRAQMSMLPRLQPKEFYDLVIEVAIVRPGPIQGGMVHPYLKRREGSEKVNYPSPAPGEGDKDELKNILERTLGVPLFQEQAMQIAMDAAEFTAAEADGLRRAMATFRRNGTIGNYRERMISRMIERGYTKDFAERCFKQIEGFGDYGFPESHAASFALLVYASGWIKVHYPDVFCAALLNAQPMGFYAPAQVVRDAERHGVVVLPPDVNHSDWDCTLEPLPADAEGKVHFLHTSMVPDIRTRCAVRLGLRQIKGIREDDAEMIKSARGRGYDSLRDLWLRTNLPRATLERLADGDAFRSVGLDRREALWAARGEDSMRVRDRLPLFDTPAYTDIRKEPDFALPPMLIGEHIVHDYRYLRLSVKGHPLAFLRGDLARRRIVPAYELRTLPNNAPVTVSGLVITRQRPGTAKGVIFMTLEDETDITNLIVWPKAYEKYRPVVLGSRLVAVTGKVQSAKGVIHVVADHIEDLSSMLASLSTDASDLPAPARADEVARPGEDNRARNLIGHPRNVRFFKEDDAKATHAVMPKGRNFH
ncbi:MAG TPA: error-prone DNA polymerase [Bauldia sp.]|nr:error-prone DNA polymerase [Bauldia sp.]